MRRAIAPLVATVVLLTSCGGRDDAADGKPTIRNPDPWTDQQVIDAIGLRTEAGGTGKTADGCYVSVILTSRQAVDVYSGAGDSVVTNPAGTAGVTTDGSDRACLRSLERGLAKLK